MENVKTTYAENAILLQEMRDEVLGTVSRLDEIDEQGNQEGGESFQQRLEKVVVSMIKEGGESFQKLLERMVAGVKS